MSLTRKAEISANLEIVKNKIEIAADSANRDPSEIKLIAVTKTFPISDLLYLYELGVRDFGENRDQEASGKVPQLPSDINWHFQGQIQSNKLKSISSWATFIHSVDQFKYAKMISDFSAGQVKSIFIQLSLDQIPDGRGGVSPTDLHDLATQINQLPNLKLMGLMAVAPVGEDPNLAFTRLAKYQNEFVQNFPEAKSLSAGMSGDYESAVSHGATHLRIGSSILGNR